MLNSIIDKPLQMIMQFDRQVAVTRPQAVKELPPFEGESLVETREIYYM